ncbi:unnamed protein product [Mytilus coruscus]|uniref:Uncharacterized protein n=1 Tax=Mytilus coruscus TaxID=42192 RepID=A0A6J8CII6_MYTCO|nr:unnamed protein product [Mytilus coruscus]
MKNIYFTARNMKVLAADGSLDYDVKLRHYAYDVECIDIDTLAVTSGDSNSKCISIVDMKYNRVKKRIPLNSDSYEIAGTDRDLIYSRGRKGIQRLNLQDNSSSQIVPEENTTYCYVARFGNKIYHTNHITNSVTCYDLKGDKQWTFNNDTILKYQTLSL